MSDIICVSFDCVVVDSHLLQKQALFLSQVFKQCLILFVSVLIVLLLLLSSPGALSDQAL